MHVPYTKLFLHDTHTIAITANGHIQVLHSPSGSLLHSTATDADVSKKVQKSGEIAAAAVDSNFKYLVTATSNKIVRAWELPELSIVSERETPKKPTDLCLTRDAQTILVSDKFGDVHRYRLLAQVKANTEDRASTSSGAKSKTAAKRLEDETLLLGHVSLITTVLLTQDERYVITADRDEHIRISWYPEAYTIERYCLGHRKFVSALNYPPWDPGLLISGGGDPVLKVWNWMDGKVVHEIDIGDTVMPFVKVTRKKSGWSEGDSDGGGQENDQGAGSRKRRKGKNMKGTGNIDYESSSRVENDDNKSGGMQVDDQPSTEQNPENKEDTPLPSPLLAIQKISTLESGSRKFLVFSAHGATALFYCHFPEPSDASPQVRSLTLNKPVLDFVQWPNSDELLVSIDGNWSEPPMSTNDSSKFIEVVKIAGDELILSASSPRQSLVDSLNTTSQVEASPDSLKNIDIYSALTVLPKNVDAEHNAMDVETQLSEATTGKLSGKELGRLKSKMAIVARQANPSSNRDPNLTPGEGQDLKRQKSESENGH